MEIDVFINPPEENGGWWVAFSQAFPACRGMGRTEDEAIENFKKSLDKCINALSNILPEGENK